MQETLQQGDYTVTLFLNSDRTVVLSKMMTATYPVAGEMVTKEAYPVPNVVNDRQLGYGTIGEQFKYIETMQRLDSVVARRRAGGNTGKPVTQTAIPLKLDNDLLEWLKDYEGEKRNTFINKAVRERIERLQAQPVADQPALPTD